MSRPGYRGLYLHVHTCVQWDYVYMGSIPVLYLYSLVCSAVPQCEIALSGACTGDCLLAARFSCLYVQNYFSTVNEFMRLEKVMFGDIRGQSLTDLVADMFTEFSDLLSGFQGKGCDPLNLSSTVSLNVVNPLYYVHT